MNQNKCLHIEAGNCDEDELFYCLCGSVLRYDGQWVVIGSWVLKNGNSMPLSDVLDMINKAENYRLN